MSVVPQSQSEPDANTEATARLLLTNSSFAPLGPFYLDKQAKVGRQVVAWFKNDKGDVFTVSGGKIIHIRRLDW